MTRSDIKITVDAEQAIKEIKSLGHVYRWEIFYKPMILPMILGIGIGVLIGVLI